MVSSNQANQRAPETRNIAIREDLHRQLKALAASQGISLKNLVEQAIINSVGDNPLSKLNGSGASSSIQTAPEP
jgi:hypothetical protein